ncbi:MAG: 6-phosphofructokinase [Candidatus Izemoplasma sp.]|nr:6-phosphofructokinase [Candidatus Izemoplasma sp.]
MRNLIYGQSGGPSSVINASAYGVLDEALKSNDIDHVFIMKHGIDGLIQNAIVSVDTFKKQLPLLKHTPSSAFGSVRMKLPDPKVNDELYKKIVHNLKANNIGFIVYNGGNDSMDTVMKLGRYFKDNDIDIKVLGVPKTVDNDLPETDHTPGFGSAAKYIINTVMQIKLDSTVYPKGKVTIIEVMGRHAGWLTAASHVASLSNLGPDLVYLPEHSLSLDQILNDIKQSYQPNHNCLVVVSEGIKDETGNFFGSRDAQKDSFGHTQLGGVASYLAAAVESTLNIKTRVIELSSTQRAAAFLRSKQDVLEAEMVGRTAVKCIQEGHTSMMVTIKRVSNNPYLVTYNIKDIASIANRERCIPKTMLNGLKMHQSFYDYILPLIQGEEVGNYSQGTQNFFLLK